MGRIRTLVAALTVLALVGALRQPLVAEEVDIWYPDDGMSFYPDATISVEGGSEYTDGTMVVDLYHDLGVVDSAIVDVDEEGCWGCKFDPPPGGWDLGFYTIRVWREGKIKASVQITVNEPPP